jgi:glutamine amidotransferase
MQRTKSQHVNHEFRNRTVGIVDYQAGNIHSIANALSFLDVRTRRVQSTADLIGCSHLILPGVGAFGFCADRLNASGLSEGLQRWAFDDKRPLLGICVGMQLLADGSDESPGALGLGWLGGTVELIPTAAGIHVPHVGWNTVEFDQSFGDLVVGACADFYFDHSYSYHPAGSEIVVARCKHGSDFCVVARQENITAAQFHPEKSQSAGMRFLRGFLVQ